MTLLDLKNRMRVEIQEKEREIEILEEKKQKRIDALMTDEEKKKIEEFKEAHRKKWILEFFKEFTKRDMNEEEYKKFTSIIDNIDTKKGYSLMSFINNENPRAEPNPKENNNGI